MWGFITVLVDYVDSRLKDVFELTFFKAGLVHLLCSLPTAFFHPEETDFNWVPTRILVA